MNDQGLQGGGRGLKRETSRECFLNKKKKVAREKGGLGNGISLHTQP